MVGRVGSPPCWRKSSYSDGGNGDCVEVAFWDDRTALRDSKRPAAGAVRVGQTQWRALRALVGR